MAALVLYTANAISNVLRNSGTDAFFEALRVVIE